MRKSSVILCVLLVGALTGCAGGVAIPASTAAPNVEAVAQETPAPTQTLDESSGVASGWLAAAALPEGAVFSATQPEGAEALDLSYTGWWCEPMDLATGYWAVPGTTVAETVNWLKAHPTADLMVPVQVPLPEDPTIDNALTGNVPYLDALEGIAFSVVKVADGVAVRAEIGALTEDSVCPTSEPGTSFGGPGQG